MRELHGQKFEPPTCRMKWRSIEFQSDNCSGRSARNFRWLIFLETAVGTINHAWQLPQIFQLNSRA